PDILPPQTPYRVRDAYCHEQKDPDVQTSIDLPTGQPNCPGSRSVPHSQRDRLDKLAVNGASQPCERANHLEALPERATYTSPCRVLHRSSPIPVSSGLMAVPHITRCSQKGGTSRCNSLVPKRARLELPLPENSGRRTP